ncbi:MAG: NADP-dependent malic enzyme [Rickettsiaceae bacterium]|nr:MAG: NADP-dependent malic enzyme [Rickettsiaceae bacterium]
MSSKTENKLEYSEALQYHALGKPGKIAVVPTKALITQHDLALAYSPGVAAPCLEIEKNPEDIYKYTARGNLVAVITNGTAVLGLGNLGPAAAKPVMEGKAVLFKNFADIDSIDLEVDTENIDEFINVVKHLGYSFGGINLEDIKAPDCFIIEEALKNYMQIPVFHDDQHGTAIITAAALINAVKITKRQLTDIKIVVNGAGAAAIACLDLLIHLGVTKENITLCDTKGVVYLGRLEGMNKWKANYAKTTLLRTLTQAMKGADVFLGLSVKDALSGEMIMSMAPEPIIFAMANPDPEITPEEVRKFRKDAIIATGRSDYNNQVNNVMGFPYIFRGALDVRARTINMEMKIAASKALAELATQPVPDQVYKAYPNRKMIFGPDYIIPVPFDPRLITTIPVAVAIAAIKSGVAQIDNLDIKKYKNELKSRLNPASSYMNFLFEKIQSSPQTIIFAEGEEEEIIKAAMILRDDKYAHPIIIGRLNRITAVLEAMGSNYSLDGITIMNAAITPNLDKYIDFLYKKLQRVGYLYRDCARLVKTDRNIFTACMIACGDGDGMITGLNKTYYSNLEDIVKVIPQQQEHRIMSYSVLVVKNRNIIIADTSISELPAANDLVEIAIQTAKIARNMGIEPKVALLSCSNFGNSMYQNATRIREAIQILDTMHLNFEYDGEISAEVALNTDLRKLYPFCRLSGAANILVMPGLHSASISTQLLQELAGGVVIGPILSGFSHAVQIVQMNSSAEDIVRVTAFVADEAINNKLHK